VSIHTINLYILFCCIIVSTISMNNPGLCLWVQKGIKQKFITPMGLGSVLAPDPDENDMPFSVQ